jgi:hypothetical protein
MEMLELETSVSEVTFADERERAGRDVSTDACVSVTLGGADAESQWGEFLTREQALALYGWLGLVLR